MGPGDVVGVVVNLTHDKLELDAPVGNATEASAAQQSEQELEAVPEGLNKYYFVEIPSSQPTDDIMANVNRYQDLVRQDAWSSLWFKLVGQHPGTVTDEEGTWNKYDVDVWVSTFSGDKYNVTAEKPATLLLDHAVSTIPTLWSSAAPTLTPCQSQSCSAYCDC